MYQFDKKWVGLHFGRFFSQAHLVTLIKEARINWNQAEGLENGAAQVCQMVYFQTHKSQFG
jgi:hypothetical protein